MQSMKYTDLNFRLFQNPEGHPQPHDEGVPSLMIGGGFIRATIAGERPSDIDIFGPTRRTLKAAAMASPSEGSAHHESDIRLHQSWPRPGFPCSSSIGGCSLTPRP